MNNPLLTFYTGLCDTARDTLEVFFLLNIFALGAVLMGDAAANDPGLKETLSEPAVEFTEKQFRLCSICLLYRDLDS